MSDFVTDVYMVVSLFNLSDGGKCQGREEDNGNMDVGQGGSRVEERGTHKRWRCVFIVLLYQEGC